MFAKIQMELASEKNQAIQFQKATVLQSILMSRIKPEYAQAMHESGLHPYSQSVRTERGKSIWTVCTSNKESYHNIIEPLQSDSFTRFVMENDSCNVSIRTKQQNIICKTDFMDRFYFTDSGRTIKVIFRTPTAFKSQGQYVFFPDLKLIYQSLMNKYDAASVDESVKSDEALEQLVAYGKIIQYRLQSGFFAVGGVKIPSFMGEITIKVAGPQAMVNFANLLFHFGEYSGIGIKTAMGMGNICVAERIKV